MVWACCETGMEIISEWKMVIALKKNGPRSLRHLAMNHLVNRREGIPRLS
jgi:hypothetical protein